MSVAPSGIHHVTAIATDPQRNVDFWSSALGLRLVKQTVNFDSPDTYHLYYGDEAGSPGTILTFFPWPGVPRGRRGTGQATVTSFSVPEGSIGWWREHLARGGVDVAEPASRLEEDALSLHDPDGLLVELVAHEGTDERPPWDGGPIPPEHAVRGLHSVTLSEAVFDDTAALFTGQLGFELAAEEGARARFVAAGGGPGSVVDVVCEPEAPRGLVSAGTVHHVAWRVSDEATQQAWRRELEEQGVDVTPVLDRKYFRSIYFREPGGVLLEVATDQPGFAIDEPLLELGRRLQLPPWLEPQRERIEAGLPPLAPPGG